MSERSPIEQRAGEIAATRAESVRLLETATHASLKDIIRLALHDLDEGLTWLRTADSIGEPSAARMAGLNIAAARGRLMIVKDAIEKRGPDAILVR